jgi:hypothetical protein
MPSGPCPNRAMLRRARAALGRAARLYIYNCIHHDMILIAYDVKLIDPIIQVPHLFKHVTRWPRGSQRFNQSSYTASEFYIELTTVVNLLYPTARPLSST